MTMTFAAPTSLVIKPLGNLPIYPDPHDSAVRYG